MIERFNFRGVPYEVTRPSINTYVVQAGSRRADCKKTFTSLQEARHFVEYNIARALDNGRFSLVDGFRGRLEPYC